MQKKKIYLLHGTLSLNNGGITMDAWKPMNPTAHNFTLIGQTIGVIAMGIAMVVAFIVFA